MVLPKHISDTINDKSRENSLHSSAVKVYLIRSFKNETSAQKALDDLIKYAVELRSAIAISEMMAISDMDERKRETVSKFTQMAHQEYYNMMAYRRFVDFVLRISQPKE